MGSTLGAATLQAKAHAVRLFSLLRHDIDCTEKRGTFCYAVECVMFSGLPYAILSGEVVFCWLYPTLFGVGDMVPSRWASPHNVNAVYNDVKNTKISSNCVRTRGKRPV